MSAVSELGPGPAVVRAWAPWCSNCRAMHPIVEDVAAAGAVRVIDLQVDESPELTEQLGIRSVPTLVAFRGGEEVGRLVGAHPRQAIESVFAAASGEALRVRSTAAGGLVAARAGVGVTLLGAAAVLDAPALLVAGAAIGLWGLVGLLQRATTARSWSRT